MQIDRLNVTLRERSSWEAIELGTALVRRDARAIWGAWLLASLPLLVLFNALAWWWGGTSFVWAWLAMWWCKPLFERSVVYVLSRSVFGEHTTALQALRGQYRWGKGLWGYLGWRRFSPVRNVALPVNLLEEADATVRARRRHALVSTVAGPAILLSTFCLLFEVVLVLASAALFFLMVPVPLLPDTWRDAWELMQYDPPAWFELLSNVIAWAAASVMAPFNIGGGFGLYLARRTQMEAWDVEISFRRLRQRLQRSGVSLALLLSCGAPLALLALPPHAQAQEQAPAQGDSADGAEETAQGAAQDDEQDPAALAHRTARSFDNDPENTAEGIFGDAPVDTAGFRQAVQRAYEDPLQRPTCTITRWVPRNPDAPEPPQLDNDWIQKIITLIQTWSARLAAGGLWLAVGVVLVLILLTVKIWLPWLRGTGRRRREAPLPVQEQAVPELPPALPDDVATQARALWQQGLFRDALALLYRASVESIVERSGQHLPLGATEAQVLRASRQLAEAEQRQLAARIVRMWQYAAYAGRMPDDAAFDQLAGQLQQHFRWQA